MKLSKRDALLIVAGAALLTDFAVSFWIVRNNNRNLDRIISESMKNLTPEDITEVMRDDGANSVGD